MEVDTHHIGPNINLKGLREVVTQKVQIHGSRYTSHGGTDPNLSIIKNIVESSLF